MQENTIRCLSTCISNVYCKFRCTTLRIRKNKKLVTLSTQTCYYTHEYFVPFSILTLVSTQPRSFVFICHSESFKINENLLINKVICIHITAVNPKLHFNTLYLILFVSYTRNIIEKRFYIFIVSFVAWRFKTTGVSRYFFL